MMGRLRAMRAPLKYAQGRDALLKFHEEMGYMGKRWLFVCSGSGYKAVHDKIEASFGDLDDYRRYEIFGGISSNGCGIFGDFAEAHRPHREEGF